MCGAPDVRLDSIFPTIPNNVNKNLISGSSVNSSRPTVSSQMVHMQSTEIARREMSVTINDVVRREIAGLQSTLMNQVQQTLKLQQQITLEELNKTRRIIEEHPLQSGLAITSLQTDNALNGQAFADLQGNTGRIIKMEAMLETLIAHIARDPSSTTQL